MTRRSISAGLALVIVMVALGLAAGWPVYGGLSFIWVALAASVAGIGIAILSVAKKWKWWLSASALVGAWLVIGFGLAVPARWASGQLFPEAIVDVVTGPVTGWKDLITVPLPVGEYRNLLVPALIVFLICTFFGTRLSVKPGTVAALAVPVTALMPFFGLLFGLTSTSSPLHLGGFTLHAPVEIAVGSLALLSSVLWLAWRARDERRAALRRAEEATGIRGQRTTRTGAAARRAALATAMVAIATVAGIVVTPLLAETREREVLRTAIGPDLTVTKALSPLATYRTSFTDGEFDKELFRIASTGKLPERIRLATLTSYDGEVYRAATGASDAFQRVPSRLQTPAGETSSVRFEISGMQGVWVPTFGVLSHVDFSGDAAPQLADRFYYDQKTGTAVEAGGMTKGTTYTVTAVTPAAPDLATARSAGYSPTVKIPQPLAKWVESLKVSDDGAGLISAVKTLRERGYLSHALRVESGSTPEWMTSLGDYSFRSSTGGHSLARVETMFSDLLERASQAASEGPDASLVAAVGDDEQFAVAAALIAQSMGFDSRVVVGFRTTGEDLPACSDSCTGGDLSAWIEVKVDDAWAILDTTPQHTKGVETQTRQERDPENMTDVRPQSAQEVAPPDPDSQESDTTVKPIDQEADLSQLWVILRWVGLGLLALIVLLAPFLVVLIAKASRRRTRRRDPDQARALAGGWEEYVDTAVDTGKPAPGVFTRRELASVYGTPSGDTLAVRADYAVFSGEQSHPDEVAEFWEIVAQERRSLRSEVGWWRRIRAALSLKSFTRHLGARGTRSNASDLSRAPERRKRRNSGA